MLLLFEKDVHWRFVITSSPHFNTEVRQQTDQRIYEDDHPGEPLAEQIIEQLVHLRLEGQSH